MAYLTKSQPFQFQLSEEAKDRYIESKPRNVLAELYSDLVNHWLTFSFANYWFLQCTNISSKYRKRLSCRIEEIDYFMRYNYKETNQNIIGFFDGH